MKKNLVSRVGALFFAIMLLFANCTSVKATNVTPDDGRWQDIEGDGYLIWAATQTDAGWLAAVQVDAGSSTATLTARANVALSDSHVINHSGMIAEGMDGAVVQQSVLEKLKAKKMWLATYNNFSNASTFNTNYAAWNFGEVTNVAEFNPAIKVGVTNAAASAKLTAGGVTVKTTLIQTTGTGSLPGAVEYAAFAVPANSFEDDNVYLYYYNASKDLYEYASQARYATGTSAGAYSYVYTTGTTSMSKHGTYVVADALLPDAVTTGKVVTVPTAGVTTTAALTTTVTSTIATATKGEVVAFEVPAGTAVSKDVWTAAIEKGVGISVESKSGTYVSWTFGSVTSAVDFDPTVTVGAQIADVSSKMSTVTLPSTLKFSPVAFAYDGTLPGAAEVTLDLSSSGFTEGQKVFMYYYNPTKKIFEKTDEATYSGGFATFTMTHCSDYVVVNEELPSELIKEATSPATGDAANLMLYLTILVLGAGVIALVAYKRRKDA